MIEKSKMPAIKELGETIYRLHGAKAKHAKSVPVKEVFNGQTVWDGVVEVFDLKGHPKASKAYAWANDTDDPLHPKRQMCTAGLSMRSEAKVVRLLREAGANISPHFNPRNSGFYFNECFAAVEHGSEYEKLFFWNRLSDAR